MRPELIVLLLALFRSVGRWLRLFRVRAPHRLGIVHELVFERTHQRVAFQTPWVFPGKAHPWSFVDPTASSQKVLDQMFGDFYVHNLKNRLSRARRQPQTVLQLPWEAPTAKEAA